MALVGLPTQLFWTKSLNEYFDPKPLTEEEIEENRRRWEIENFIKNEKIRLEKEKERDKRLLHLIAKKLDIDIDKV